MSLVVPVRAAHVNTAYAEACGGAYDFRSREMRWLEQHNPLLGGQLKGWFASAMARYGESIGEPYLLGSALGHRAIRLCTDETGDYGATKKQYLLNVAVTGSKLAGEPWNTPEALDRVFGDPELTASLLQVKYDLTRAAAASTLGYLCLDEIPNVPQLPCDRQLIGATALQGLSHR